MAAKEEDVKEDYQICDPDVFKYVTEFYLESLKKRATELHVELQDYDLDQDFGLEITGRRKNDVRTMLEYVGEVVRSIKVDHTHLEDAGYFFTAEGKRKTAELEHQHGVILNFEDKLADTVLVNDSEGDYTEITKMFQWTFRDKQQLCIKTGRGVETGAKVVTDAFETNKVTDFKTEDKRGISIVQFPVPYFNESGHTKKLRTRVLKLFETFCDDGYKTFAIEVDSCQSWPLKSFSHAVIMSFVDYLLSGECPPEFRLHVCVLNEDKCKVAMKCCSDLLIDKCVNKFEFKQIDEPIVTSLKKNRFMQVEVLEGDICQIKADAIVNTTSPDLDLGRGGASRALLKAGGKNLQRDLDRYYENGLDYGQIGYTKGYHLPCKFVLHGFLQKYDEKVCSVYKTEEDFYKTSVHEFMRNCLTEAVKLDCATVSFPVIGTGSLLYPIYIVAEQMFQTIELFEAQSKLETVNIVIYDNDEEVLQMFQELKRKYDAKHRKENYPAVQARAQKAKLLKIAGPDQGIKAAKGDILKLLKKDADTDTEEDRSPRFQSGQKLVKETENCGIKDGTFKGKSASRSLQNLNVQKHPSETSLHSSRSPTSPSIPSGNESMGLGQSMRRAGLSEEDEIKESQRHSNAQIDKHNTRSTPSGHTLSMRDSQEPSEPNKNSVRSQTGTLHSSRRGYEEEREKVDLSVTITGNKREVSEGEQDKKVIVNVSELQYDLLEFFHSKLTEEYKKRGCLLVYDQGAIVLHGACFDIKTVKMEVTNAVKKVTELQSGTVDVHTFSRADVKKHAADLTTGDVLCVFDKHVTEVTVYSESYEKTQSTLHQLKMKLGIIRETGRIERQLANTSTYLRDMDTTENSRINNARDNESGGARPKMKNPLQKQFSWSSNTEFLEMFHVEKKIVVRVYKADILNLPVDCIVNAANKNLQHGGGVAKVISDAAGRELDKEGWDHVRRYGEVKVGEVCTTTAGRLKYACVIHSVGPNWYDYRPHTIKDVKRCETDLHNAVYNSIKKAEERGLKSIAIPGISAGIYACPKELCFVQYAKAVWDYSKKAKADKKVEEIHFVDMKEDIVKHIQYTFKAMMKENGKVPKSYDINQIVTDAQWKLRGPHSRLTDHNKNSYTSDKQAQFKSPSVDDRGNFRPQSGKPKDNRPLPDKPGQSSDESSYPYISSKPLPGYTGGNEFVCVVSPNLSLYVYLAGITDNISDVDIIACGETRQGNGTGPTKSVEKWCGTKFVDEKKKRFKFANGGDVIVVPGSVSTVKFVAYVIMYQKTQTKNEDDRRKKMTEIFRKLFDEAKKNKCKCLALPLPGSGKALGVKYGTERLCEGLNSFATDNPKYKLTVHLINTDLKKTDKSIETIKDLVDKHKKGISPADPKKTPYDEGNKRHRVGGHTGMGPKPVRSDRPKSANYKVRGNQKPCNIGSKSMLDQIKTQEFERTAPTDKPMLPAVYDAAKENLSSAEESEKSDSEEDAEEDIKEPEEKSEVESKEDTKPDNCVICMEMLKKPRRLVCGHEFCNDCIEEQFTYKEACPVCGKVCGLIKGDQPEGTMSHRVNKQMRCAGFEKFARIEITYNFPDGKQGPEHPDPGKCYKGITRVAFLPNNKQGKQILEMLKIAFDRKLVFTIGSSRTTGQEGVITWNDVHHKTDPKPNSQFGYPDPSYLDRVTDELAAKGVTENDIGVSSRK